MKTHEPFPQKGGAEQSSIERYEMKERSRSIRSDELDASVPCRECEKTGGYSYVKCCCNRPPGQVDPFARSEFKDRKRQSSGGRNHRNKEQKTQPVHHRAHP